MVGASDWRRVKAHYARKRGWITSAPGTQQGRAPPTLEPGTPKIRKLPPAHRAGTQLLYLLGREGNGGEGWAAYLTIRMLYFVCYTVL